MPPYKPPQDSPSGGNSGPSPSSSPPIPELNEKSATVECSPPNRGHQHSGFKNSINNHDYPSRKGADLTVFRGEEYSPDTAENAPSRTHSPVDFSPRREQRSPMTTTTTPPPFSRPDRGGALPVFSGQVPAASAPLPARITPRPEDPHLDLLAEGEASFSGRTNACIPGLGVPQPVHHVACGVTAFSSLENRVVFKSFDKTKFNQNDALTMSRSSSHNLSAANIMYQSEAREKLETSLPYDSHEESLSRQRPTIYQCDRVLCGGRETGVDDYGSGLISGATQGGRSWEVMPPQRRSSPPPPPRPDHDSAGESAMGESDADDSYFPDSDLDEIVDVETVEHGEMNRVPGGAGDNDWIKGKGLSIPSQTTNTIQSNPETHNFNTAFSNIKGKITNRNIYW